MLAVEKIHTYYGMAHVLFDVTLEVADGQIACLLGRNGVGKSTCLRSIMGLTQKRVGSITFRGKEIGSLAPFQIARAGIGYVPEDRRIFPDLTVRENLEVAYIRRKGIGSEWTVERAYEIFPPLKEFAEHRGSQLSGGQQQMLAIARTLMGNPSLLLLDEPTEGLSPLVVSELERQILRLKSEGLTMLLAAQDVRFASKIADYIYIMDRGMIVYSGSSEQVRRDEATVKAYLAV